MNQLPTTPDPTDEPPLLVTGDGAEASAAIDAWRVLRETMDAPDWEGVLGLIRDALAKLVRIPLLRHDPHAMAIVDAMVAAANMEQFAAEVDRLAERTQELLGNSDRRRSQATVLSVALLQSWNNPSLAERSDEGEAPSRMVLRL